MKISELLKQDKVTLSFEVFPPKTSSSYESVARATQEIAALRPDFMSVTYGAGGGTSEHTVNIAADLKKKYDVTVLTHLTCVSSTREHDACDDRDRDSLLADTVQEIIHDIVVKEHLRGQKFAACLDLFLQMQNVLGLVRRLYMTLRIACAADAEVAL